MWYFEEECNCNHRIINFRSITFMINDSRMSSDVVWWHIFTEKIMPLRQNWSEEQRKAMR